MKTSLPWLALFGVLALVSCASKNDANEKDFSQALNAYLAQKGELCLGIPSAWPVDLNEAERRSRIGRAAEMAALEKAGLVRSHETETEYTPPFSTRPVKVKVLRYELTEEGKKFYRAKETFPLIGKNGTQGDLCYGQQKLDKIVKWEGPTTVGDSKEATVFYTYRVANLAAWASNPEIQKVFPGILSTTNGAGQIQMNQALTLTSQGWQAKGLDSHL
ncbi:MAG TPA: hypothetical protein VHX36_09605 [Candidatus Acidoferrales bacterium]|jgi:hypothetical protein|nr:hypothetical protein [Candidatus Acidoferrales bacterium]